MKAMLSRSPGGPDSLSLETLETPDPGPGEVRIAVRAAGVNFPDTLIIADRYQFKPERPFAPGGEVAGVIEAVGPGVEAVAVGDRVLAVLLYGGYASHVVCPAASVTPIPAAMSFEHAAGLVLTYATMWHGLVDRGRLAAGERVLVLGGAGGIGVASIQIAKARGAAVIAAVSSDAKAATAREAGAQEVVVYPPGPLDKAAQKALSKQLKTACGGQGPDVIVDPVGGDYAEPALRAIAWRGRYLVIGFPAGIPAIPLNLPLLKGCDIVGVFWGAHLMAEPDRHHANMTALFTLYAQGAIRPDIQETWPLEQASEALTRLVDRTARGKIILTVPES
ncbi:MAG: NADPH:quinone oxidoreductase family protein [Maricaulaceae bacterium]